MPVASNRAETARLQRPPALELPIDLTAWCHVDNDYDQLVFVDFVDDPVLTHPYPPGWRFEPGENHCSLGTGLIG